MVYSNFPSQCLSNGPSAKKVSLGNSDARRKCSRRLTRAFYPIIELFRNAEYAEDRNERRGKLTVQIIYDRVRTPVNTENLLNCWRKTRFMSYSENLQNLRYAKRYG